MRKKRDYQYFTLMAVIVLVILIHSCMKKEGSTPPDNCKQCYATKNGSSDGSATVCNDNELSTFKNQHPGAEVTCY